MRQNSRSQLNRRSTDRLQEFISNLPCMICQIELQANGSITFTYASEGCATIFNVTSDALRKDGALFLNLIHQDDFQSFLDTLKQSANTLLMWKWEGRLALPNKTTKWISLSATPQNNQNGLRRWEGIVLDITQNKLSELESKRIQRQLQELSSHIQDVKEQERLHIAHEIHDEIGSLLTAIKIDLAWVNQRLPNENQSLLEKEKTIEELVNKAITSANNLAHRLRPGFLDCFGIIAAIEIEAQEFSKRSGIPCDITASQENIELPEMHSITLFRICQEALNNILKHAHAKSVQIEIVKGTDHLELIISDDGVGFSETERNKPRSFGLRGVHERVAHLGGTVKMASNLGMGTQIAIFIPLKEETPQQALFGDASI